MTPEIGMGATYRVGSDSYPYTIESIERRNKAGQPTMITMRGDNAKRTDSNGLSEAQEYEYTSNPKGSLLMVSKRADGSWRVVNSTGSGAGYVTIGVRRMYRDPSF